jgi:hypothetical protein
MNIYIIIPTGSLSQAMINRSVNKRIENIRTNILGTSIVIEVENPVPSIYNDYQWYSKEEMELIISGEEWQS